MARIAWLVCATLGGCSFSVKSVPLDGTAMADLAAPPVEDLATEPDLALPDLSMPDLALPDLSMPDLAPPICPPEAALLACFRFEGNANDESINANNPTVTGTVSFVPGRNGNALQMGALGSVLISDRASLDVTEAITLEAWIRPDAIPTNRFGVIDNNGQYGLFIYSSGRLRCTGHGMELYTANDVITAGVWQHVACVYDRVNMRAYVSGVERASIGATAAIATTDVTGTAIGSDSPPPGDGFNGLIDDVRIWSTPRPSPSICAAAGGNGC